MLDSIPIVLIVGASLGFLSGLGIGGGSLLILWLTMVLEMPQADARVLNLLFFLPAALIACLLRWKQGTIHWAKIIPAMISGCIGAGLFSWLGGSMDLEVLKKLFGGLLILTGLRELAYRPRALR